MQGQMQRMRSQQKQPASRMDSFMFGQRPSPQPGSRSSFPTNLQQLNPTKLLNSPQISKGLSGFSGILNNIQQVLQVVETTTPIIREYGPMVKNLPAMYRMVKAFKEVDNEPSSEEGDEEKVKENKEEDGKKRREETITKPEKKEQTSKPRKSGLSTPKLFI